MNNESEKLSNKKTDLHMIDVRTITVQDNFNVRRDYGNMGELTESIRQNGVLQPLRCYRRNGEFILVDGHRRLKACLKIIEEDNVSMRVSVVTEGRNVSPEQRVIDMITLNEGKRLNPLEEAEAVSRLLNYGLQEVEVSHKIGKTLTYISNLKLIHSAPEKIKVMVRSEQISSTLLMQLMRDTTDFEELQDLIHTAFLSVAEGKPEKDVKITNKDIQKVQKKSNSVSALKKALKFAQKQELPLNAEKVELYEFACALIDGKYTKEQLLEMFFFEPDLTAPVQNKDVKNKPFESTSLDG